MDKIPLFAELKVDTAPITSKELRKAVRRFKDGKAVGPDEIPIEYWKIVLNSCSHGAHWLLNFCNSVWLGRRVPDSWHLQQVVMIFKKGDSADCGNYRPICLLNSAYKLFAMVLLVRLLEAGADDRMHSSQFGFRPGRGTEHALHCARRAIDVATALRDSPLHLMALDWRKAFDSISPESLLTALQRFGVPQHMLEVVRSIYSDRKFVVKECGIKSGLGTQHSGVCQGCPLSPFLFGIVMTVLMHDAYKSLGEETLQESYSGRLYDILYADDTLLLGVNARHVEELADAVERTGLQYGLTLHWGKTQALSINANQRLQKPDGSPIEDHGHLIYLGALIDANGRPDSELSRRIGMAAGDFQRLQKLWSHASVSVADKLKCLNAFVTSRLLYGLSTMVLVECQRRRLDGLYARCLRRILRIPAAYVSRV
jgi:hypothetical protein